jgi:hypothetical protein
VGAPTYFGTSSAHQQRGFGKIGRPKGPRKTKEEVLCRIALQSVRFRWAHLEIMHCNCIIIIPSSFFLAVDLGALLLAAVSMAPLRGEKIAAQNDFQL